MCGRYRRQAGKHGIAEWMQTHITNVYDDSYLAPSYNVAPQSFQPVVRHIQPSIPRSHESRERDSYCHVTNLE
jgi:putative SOS response-associated peptidase YedK